MLTPTSSLRVLVCTRPTDMRKNARVDWAAASQRWLHERRDRRLRVQRFVLSRVY